MTTGEGLTNEEKRKLKARFADLSNQPTNAIEEEISFKGAPFITESTYDHLVAEYNLLGHSWFKEPTIDMEHRDRIHPYLLGRELAMDSLRTIQETEGPFVSSIRNWIQSVHCIRGYEPDPRNIPVHYMDAMVVGLGFVLQAYEAQMGPSFDKALQKLKSHDITNALPDFTWSKRITLIDRSLSPTQIPTDQIFLDRGLKLLKDASPIQDPIEDGAGAMYQALDKLWPKIAPHLEKRPSLL